jgi:hypothetical protein
MPLDKKFYIHTGTEGALEDTSPDDVRALVAELKNASKVVIHLHDGLIKKSNALGKAECLRPAYETAGARPVFLVWESGLIETVQNNLREIEKEKILRFIVKRVLKYAVGKLSDVDGFKASAQLPLPKDIDPQLSARRLPSMDNGRYTTPLIRQVQ